jgi:hypothetical protein
MNVLLIFVCFNLVLGVEQDHEFKHSNIKRDVKLCSKNVKSRLLEISWLYFMRNCCLTFFLMNFLLFMFVLKRNYTEYIELDREQNHLNLMLENINKTLSQIEKLDENTGSGNA